MNRPIVREVDREVIRTPFCKVLFEIALIKFEIMLNMFEIVLIKFEIVKNMFEIVLVKFEIVLNVFGIGK